MPTPCFSSGLKLSSGMFDDFESVSKRGERLIRKIEDVAKALRHPAARHRFDDPLGCVESGFDGGCADQVPSIVA